MRFLHTGDWHLGKKLRGESRQREYEQVLDEVLGIAVQEGVDVLLLAGDIDDAFSPPPEAERLLYETAARLLSDKIRIVMIAGNHDTASHMDALSGILRMAGVYSTGSLPARAADAVVRVPSRDGKEQAAIAAVPWVPERLALRWEVLMEEPGVALASYADGVAEAIRRVSNGFSPGDVNVFLGHMWIDGAVIANGGGERKLHKNFAVSAQALPAAAQYVALGHLHKPQQIAAASPAFYAGSLFQLDFGETGQQKSVRIVEAHPGLPAQSHEVPLTVGRGLRNVRCTLGDIEEHRGRYGDDYLKVIVDLPHPEPALYDRVREVLPNAVEVISLVARGPGDEESAPRAGLAPHELFQRYYQKTYGGEAPSELLDLFNQLYKREAEHAAS